MHRFLYFHFTRQLNLAPGCVSDTADSCVRADSPAWHRRARRNRARARLLLTLVRARDLLTRHHGSHPPKEEMVNTWTCRGTGSCGYQHNWFSHSYCWKCNKKYESVVYKAKRPRQQRIVDAAPESSELVKARQAVAKLEAACAADPDDAECKELYERKKQRLEQLESERDSPFDLLQKLKASREKLDKRKQSESGHEKVRKEQEESERVDRELAEMEDQHRQLEQRHRASAEQEQQRALEANATNKPLHVWEGLRKLQAEGGINAAARDAVEILLSVSQPFETTRCEKFEAESKPIVDDDDAEMEDGVDPTPEEIERSGRAAREAQKRHDNLLRRADDAKRRKVEQSDEVGVGNDTFRWQA